MNQRWTPIRLGLVGCLLWVASCSSPGQGPSDSVTIPDILDVQEELDSARTDLFDLSDGVDSRYGMDAIDAIPDVFPDLLLDEVELFDIPKDIPPELPPDVEIDLVDLEPELTDLVADVPLDLEEEIDVPPDIKPDIPVAPLSPIAINEFLVTPTSQEAVELYNRLDNPIFVGEWSLNIVSDVEKVWLLPEVVIPPNDFLVLTKDNMVPQDGITFTSILPNAGGVITLSDEDGNVVEEVAYGTRGPVPLPVYGTSTARLLDGNGSANPAFDFNWDRTPTLGFPNDPPGVLLEPATVQVNELLAKVGSGQGYVEFLVLGDLPVDVSGWIFVFSGEGAGGQATWPDEQEWLGYTVIEQSELPAYSQFQDNGVIYLYNSIGVRMMQMGWSGLDMDGGTALGVPPSQTLAIPCYDTPTCGLVGMTPTKGAENPAIEQ